MRILIIILLYIAIIGCVSKEYDIYKIEKIKSTMLQKGAIIKSNNIEEIKSLENQTIYVDKEFEFVLIQLDTIQFYNRNIKITEIIDNYTSQNYPGDELLACDSIDCKIGKTLYNMFETNLDVYDFIVLEGITNSEEIFYLIKISNNKIILYSEQSYLLILIKE